MSVTRLRKEMPQGEFVYWGAYHALKGQRQELENKSIRGKSMPKGG
jgi:hypothetical protein